MLALSLKNINNAVANIRKKPMPDPSKSLCPPDLTDMRAKYKIMPIIIDPVPIKYLRVIPTSNASEFEIIFGNIVIAILLAKNMKTKPIKIITIPLSAKIVLELCKIKLKQCNKGLNDRKSSTKIFFFSKIFYHTILTSSL